MIFDIKRYTLSPVGMQVALRDAINENPKAEIADVVFFVQQQFMAAVFGIPMPKEGSDSTYELLGKVDQADILASAVSSFLYRDDQAWKTKGLSYQDLANKLQAFATRFNFALSTRDDL